MPARTYIELQHEIASLQEQATRLRNEEVAGVVARIKVAISVYGLTVKDLFGSKSLAVKSKAIKSHTAKYADGKGGEWVGRGPRPQWLRSAVAAGTKLEDLAVGSMKSGASAVAVAPAVPPVTKVATVATVEPAPAKRGKKVKAAKKRGGKARYGDGAGNSWSGFGPKPRWLKDAIGNGKKIEDLIVKN